MKKFWRLVVGPMSTVGVVGAPMHVAQAKMTQIFKLRAPVEITELVTVSLPVTDAAQLPTATSDLGLGPALQVDTSKTNFELTLWEYKGTYHYESRIDMKGVNQAILPTDDYGKLTPEAFHLGSRPFIRYFFPGKEPLTQDITCSPQRCRAIWKNVTYDPNVAMQKLQIEVNVRGLHGRHWNLTYNQPILTEHQDFKIPLNPDAPQRISILSPLIQWPDLRSTSYQREAFEIDSLEEWTFKKGQNTGFRKAKGLMRLHILSGQFTLEMTNGDNLEERTLNPGQVLWLLPGQVIRLSSPQKESHLKRLSFVLKKPLK